jgi:glycosyltransferase involved in cell wall biosynthesis
VKVAIVHDWLETYAGSERVLEQLIGCFPTADVFAVVDFLPDDARGFLQGRPVRTSFIQRLPFSRKIFRHYLGLMPLAIEQFDMTGYDVVISSNHAVAKGVLTGPDQLHISYIHSPMRYAWDLQHQYLRQTGLDRGVRGMMTRWLLHRMRMWDARSANGVDVFVANSRYIARRIRKTYRRDAIVIPPPVEVESFALEPRKGDFFLVVSRFVPYKRVDLIVEAFAAMPERRLVVVGDDPELLPVDDAVRGGANIEFRGPVPHIELVRLLQGARALVCAAEEDFGITMVEAQACGTPVIAYGRGGAREIVADIDTERPTGVLFEPQTSQALMLAVRRFDEADGRITAEGCRANALRFSRENFRTRILSLVEDMAATVWRPSGVPTSSAPPVSWSAGVAPDGDAAIDAGTPRRPLAVAGSGDPSSGRASAAPGRSDASSV